MKKIITLIMCAVAVFAAHAQDAASGTLDATTLNIVGETTYDILQEPGTFWWGNEVHDNVPAEGIAARLGVEPEYLQEHLPEMIYATQIDANTGQPTTLVKDGNATPSPGYYFMEGNAFDEDTEVYTKVGVNTPWDNAIFYFDDFQYNAENPEYIHMQVGQVWDTKIEIGTTYPTDIYIVNGTDAYVFHFNMLVDVPDTQFNVDKITKVGEIEWTIDQRDPRMGWDTFEEKVLDMDGILAQFSAAMGKDVAADDLEFMAIEGYGSLTNALNAWAYDELNGYWLDYETGILANPDYYVSKQYFVNFVKRTEGAEAPEEGAEVPEEAGATTYLLTLGNMPGVFAGGERMSAKLYLVADSTHYVEINLSMSFKSPDYTLETCEIVEAERVVQVVPATESWVAREVEVQDIEWLAEGSNLKFYGVNADGTISDWYSVSECEGGAKGGGFWMSAPDENETVYPAGWTGNGAYAIWYYNGTFTIFTIPGFEEQPSRANATFYMANLWDGKAVKLNLTLRFVSEIKEIEPVATEDLELAGRDGETGKSFSEVDFDLAACAEAFGMTVDEVLESAEMQVVNRDGDLTAETNEEGVFTFNANGEIVAADSEDAIFWIGQSEGSILSCIISDENLANSYKATIYMVYNYEEESVGEDGETITLEKQKIYAYNVTVKCGETTPDDPNDPNNPDVPDTITSVDAQSAVAKTYDMNGREVAQPAKGLYIKSGKKYVVK